MDARSIFFNEFGKLRSGWRFAVFIALMTLAGMLFGGLAIFALGLAFPEAVAGGTPLLLAVNGVVSLAISLGVGWFCGKYLENLPFRALGAAFTKGWLKHFVLGSLLGVVSLSFAVLIGMIFGGLSFRFNAESSGTAILRTLIFSFLIFAAAAAFEEALFRGYILQTFMRSGHVLFGIVLTSLLFATVHNANPGATAFSWINTFLAGVWFAVAYLKTRDLWLPFGLHLTWNWAQGSIFGVEVSGLTDLVSAPLMRETDVGPAWLTGGNYGIEGGIACTVALAAATAAVYFLPIAKPTDEMIAFTSTESKGLDLKGNIDRPGGVG